MTCDPRIPADEQGDIIASQAAGYRLIQYYRAGRKRVTKSAVRNEWTDEQVEAANALCCYQYGPRSEKTNAHLQHVVLKALERRDARFFAGLGRIFKNEPSSIWQMSNRLDLFLLAYWTEAFGTQPALCLLSDADLTEVCIRETGREGLTLAALTKARQRLQLVSSSRKLTPVRREGKIVGFEEPKSLDKGKHKPVQTR